MMNYSQIKKISLKVYKFKQKRWSYHDTIEKLNNSASETDLYHWLVMNPPSRAIGT